MKLVNIFEAKAQLSELLEAAANGERVVICKRNQPIAELRPVAAPRTARRPLGLAPGSATVGPAFFDPLPDALVADFETPAASPGEGTRASRVAEPRAPLGRATASPASRRPKARR